MKSTIYYFTGTGNSLALARELAGKLSAELISIPSVVGQDSIKVESDSICIVFPVYFVFNGGIPLIVGRFIDKLECLVGKRVCAIASFGTMSGGAIGELERMIQSRGGRLSAAYTVKMPYNYIQGSGELAGTRQKESREMLEAWASRLGEICVAIGGGIEAPIKRGLRPAGLLRKFGKARYGKIAGIKAYADLPFTEVWMSMDSRFSSSDACDSCGICAKICPARNIEMRKGRPLWNHRCEQCFACLQWCPREAILLGGSPVSGKTYHHPRVKLNDLFRALDA